jgi:hypothetical protein
MSATLGHDLQPTVPGGLEFLETRPMREGAPYVQEVITYERTERPAWRLRRWLFLALLYTPLLSSTVISKLSVPQIASMGLSIGIPITIMVTAAAMLCGAFVIDLKRLALYVALVASACLSQATAAAAFSVTSIAFLIGLFYPVVFGLKPTALDEAPVSTDSVLLVFSRFAQVVGVAGIVQYFAQYVIGPRFAYPIEFNTPPGFLILTYNYLNVLFYGSHIYKSNGVFFLEPSFFSQFIAMALLLELSLWNRKTRIALYLVTLAVTYSGTGIVMLGAGLVTYVFVSRKWSVAIGAVVVVTVVFLFAEPLGLGAFVTRATEFQSTGSSGFERFVAWTYIFADNWWTGDLVTALFGKGAGTFALYSNNALYHAAEISFSKMFFEFGFVGGGLYFALLFYVIFKAPVPLAFKVAMAVSLFLNQAYSMQIVGILLTVFIWPVRSEAWKLIASPANHLEEASDDRTPA